MKKLKVYFETYGCSLNFADTDIMKGFLEDEQIVNSYEDADVVAVNTCTVKGPTENKMLRRIKFFSSINKPVVVAGCLAEAQPELVKHYVLVGPEHLDKIKDAMTNAYNGKIVHYLGENRSIVSSYFFKKFHTSLIEIIPISRGCLGQCSFCITKFSRKQLKSYPVDVIIDRIRFAVEHGIKEIWLTSEDLGCYGLDINTNIVELIKKINDFAIKSNKHFFIRLGMSNPNYIVSFIDELLPLISNGPYFRFLHLPLQSGSNNILMHMKRMYNVEIYLKLIDKIRNFDEKFTISTDVIVGYPSETEKDFEKTQDVLQKIQPDVVNISRFWPRPKTEASKLQQLHGRIIKERSRILTKLVNQLEFKRNQFWLNQFTSALVDEIGDDFITARNVYYKPIAYSLVQSDDKKNKNISEKYYGKILNFHIKGIKPHYLIGEIANNSEN